MLLRNSKIAGVLTKKAFLGAIAKKVGGGALGMLGRGIVKHPKAALAVTAGTSAAITEVSGGLRRAKVGMSPQWSAARRAGVVSAPLPPKTPNF